MPSGLAPASAQSILSRQNGRLKDLRQRMLHPAQTEDGRIALEGEHLVEEARRSGLQIHSLFLREDWRSAAEGLAAESAAVFIVAADAFNHACATESPQGIAAIVEAPQWSFEAVLNTPEPRLIVLDGLQDPGNAGTIIRTAEAFGATGVLLTPPAVCRWNQKLLRSSAGSALRLPMISLEDASPLRQLRKGNIPLYACVAHAGDPVENTDLSGPWAGVIGNEGAGISEQVLRLCSGALHIPCPGPVESLNAGIAAAILLYESSRQRSAREKR